MAAPLTTRAGRATCPETWAVAIVVAAGLAAIDTGETVDPADVAVAGALPAAGATRIAAPAEAARAAPTAATTEAADAWLTAPTPSTAVAD